MYIYKIIIALLISFTLFNSQALALSKWEEDNLNNVMYAFETSLKAKIGIFAINTKTQESYGYNEIFNFPLADTVEVVCVANILKRSMSERDLLNKKLKIPQKILENSPYTQNFAGKTRSILQLCAATLQLNDHTALDVLQKFNGGGPALYDFTKNLGLHNSRSVDTNRYEPDPRTTLSKLFMKAGPKLMAMLLYEVYVENLLDKTRTKMFKTWLQKNNSNANGIVSALPKGSKVEHITGFDVRTSNDLGIIYLKGEDPKIFAIYITDCKAHKNLQIDTIKKITKTLLNSKI